MANVIDWFMIPSNDFDRAVGFYSNILGIEMPRMTSPTGMELAFFKEPTSEGVGGAVSADPNRNPGSDGTLVYLDAEGVIDDILGKVEGAGGQIAVPKMNIGEFGNIAMIMDTEGNSVGLHSNS